VSFNFENFRKILIFFAEKCREKLENSGEFSPVFFTKYFCEEGLLTDMQEVQHSSDCVCHVCTLKRNKEDEIAQWQFQREVDEEAEQEAAYHEHLAELRVRYGEDHVSPASSPLSPSGSEAQDEEVSDQVPRILVRAPAGKAPWVPRRREPSPEEDEEIIEHDRAYKANFRKRLACDEELVDEPDLAEYFAPFKMSKPQVIAMCRTYANHLAQQVRFSSGSKPRKYNKK